MRASTPPVSPRRRGAVSSPPASSSLPAAATTAEPPAISVTGSLDVLSLLPPLPLAASALDP
eukprot:763525-Hanusia_phi.AAC.2